MYWLLVAHLITVADEPRCLKLILHSRASQLRCPNSNV